MSQANEVGKRLVEMCQQGQSMEAIEQLYADDCVSLEAHSMPEMPNPLTGKEAIIGKSKWWYENFEVHSTAAKGPYPHGEDRFAVIFSMDVTNKMTGQRTQSDEVAVYTVKDGKVVHEAFFYDMEEG